MRVVERFERRPIEVSFPITPALRRAARAMAGRERLTDAEVERMMRRELETLVANWTAYGAWMDRVDSGEWFRAYRTRKTARVEGRRA